jgi:predicted GNAT family acetyltransferase
MSPELSVADNPAADRYELHVDSELVGFITYRRSDGVLSLLHAEVDPNQERRGLGSALAAGALDDVRARGLSVHPLCPFVASFIARHPQYADLVT